MKRHHVVTIILFALLARCILGQLAFVAGVGSFENPNPTTFQRLHVLLGLGALLIPAALIGGFLERRIIAAAMTVEFVALVADWVWNEHGIVPTGGVLPEPPILLIAVVEDAIFSVLLAAALAIGIRLLRLRAREYVPSPNNSLERTRER